jgi:hypothetical protein
MIIISHRGNVDGPQSCAENHPESISFALSLGFDVEVDLWVTEELDLFLGHDHPQYRINLAWLEQRKKSLWIHCKDLGSLEYFTNSQSGFNFFFHQKDDYTLTSKGFVWVYPGKSPPSNSVVVLPEIETDWLKQLPIMSNIYGVCTDFPNALKQSCIS